MNLKDTQCSRLVKYPAPCRAIELVVAPVERQRIGTIGAAERATVCQFGKQTEGRRQAGTIRRHDEYLLLSFPRPRKRNSNWFPAGMNG
jgi:hypothetical protein